jgi:hypothetical protein
VYYFWTFGAVLTLLLLTLSLLKICWTLPKTTDAGDIIPHVLLMKVPAMAIYPSLGGYINYCSGFLLAELPMLNTYFSDKFTYSSDWTPPSYKMFYNNLNIASTYLLPLIVFVCLMVPLTVYSIYSKWKKQRSSNANQNHFIDGEGITLVGNLQSLTYNIFIVGLTFNSVLNLIGMVHNPASALSVNGVFYIFGVFVFAAVIANTAIDYWQSSNLKLNRIRIIIKACLMAMLYWSPLPLFVLMAVIDVMILMKEY